MVDVVTSIVISLPRSRVVTYASNPDHAPTWYANIKAVEWRTPKPLGVGSAVAFVAHFLGRRLSYTYAVTELSADKLIMRTAEGPFPMETTYSWEELNPQTTRMTLRNRGYPSGFSKLVVPLLTFMMRRANEKDLRRLKQILEKG